MYTNVYLVEANYAFFVEEYFLKCLCYDNIDLDKITIKHRTYNSYENIKMVFRIDVVYEARCAVYQTEIPSTGIISKYEQRFLDIKYRSMQQRLQHFNESEKFNSFSFIRRSTIP